MNQNESQRQSFHKDEIKEDFSHHWIIYILNTQGGTLYRKRKGFLIGLGPLRSSGGGGGSTCDLCT